MSPETREPISSLLGPAAVLAEQGFLAAGQSLEGALEILDRLARRFAAYVAELMGSVLHETSSGLAAASEQVATLASTHRSDVATLGSLDRVMAEINRRVTALQPTPREVETLSLSARVVAGGMGTAGADFLAFAASIRNAAHRVRSSLLDVREGLGMVNQDLGAARANAASFVHRHGDTMQSIPTRLAANLRSLTVQQGLAADAATQAQRQSEDVRQQVSNQIVALQLGDITRQRVEHVCESGQLIAGLAAPRGLAGRLLAAQLRDTADTLSQEGERIEARLTQLAVAAHAIGQLGAQLRGETSEQTGGFVATLEADIRQTASPVTELRVADAATDQHMAAVLNAAEQLATRFGTLQSVEEDIRIMGLNATLKCGRLGSVGRPLAVVAQELRTCGGRFAGEVAAVVRDLGHLRSIAASLRDPAREARHAALAEAMDGMLEALHRLGRLESEMVSALAQIQADADAVGQLVETALSRFSVRHALAAAMQQAASGFASWATEDEVESAEAGNVLDQIAERYTMAREREVHARLAPLPSRFATAPVAAEEMEPADFLF